MACKPKTTEKKTPKKGKIWAVMAILVLLALCLPAFSAVPMTYLMGLRADSLSSSGGGSFAGHVTFDWISVDTFSGTFSSTGRITGTDLEVSDSAKAATFTGTGIARFGSASAFSILNGTTVTLANGADTSAVTIATDTLRINGTGTTGNVKISNNLTLDDSLKGVSGTFSGRIKGTDVEASDSVIGNTGTFSTNVREGTAAKFWQFLSAEATIGKDTDTSSIILLADTLKVNTTGTTGNVKIWGDVLMREALVETLSVTGWQDVDYLIADTLSFGGQVRTTWPDTANNAINWLGSAAKADTTGRPACAFGNSKGAGGDDTIDTLVNTLISATSIVILTPRFAATGAVYIAGQAEDSLFIGYAAADSTGSRVYGIDYWIKE